MKAMILAAGMGTRLRPFSLNRPKPLFPVLARPLLLLTVDRLKKAGFRPIIVNAHHLAGQIRDALQQDRDIILQHEEEVLGTGGGLRKALPRLGKEPVLVTNGDIYHTIDLRDAYQSHCQSERAITMVMHDFPRFNRVAVDEECRVLDFGPEPADETGGEVQRLAFTGIHIIRPEILRLIPADTRYSILDCYRTWMRQGETIRADIRQGHTWYDIGTLEDYLELHAGLLSGRIPSYEELGFTPETGPFFVPDDAVLGKNVRLRDWVCIGHHARVGDNVVLQRAVVWEGACIAPGAELRETIVT